MNAKYENKNEYVLSDFYGAVYLKTCGLQLIGINRTDPRRFRFVFEDREDRAKLIEDFFVGRGRRRTPSIYGRHQGSEGLDV